MTYRHLILDRDGVLNFEAPPPGFVMRPEEFRWLPGALDAVLCCPHAPDAGCACRKPEPGLIREAIARSGISAEESLVIGDDDRDLQAAAHAGVRAALVRTGKGRATEERLADASATIVYDDLRALARTIAGAT